MGTYIFQLSELGEFGLVLQEQNKENFVRRFAECIKQLLCAKMTESYIMSNQAYNTGNILGTDPLIGASFCNWPDFKTDWALLKEMVFFIPDERMRKLIAKNLRFLNRCRARIEKLAGRGLWYLLHHCRRYRSIRRYFRSADRTVTFQDLFSAAIAEFVMRGWGKAGDFKLLLNKF